jgi:hypothetical protein
MQHNDNAEHVREKRFSWSYINEQVDPVLLAFLILFPIDKVVIKPLALILGIAWLGRRFRFRDIKAAPPFYFLILIPALLQFLFFNSDFSMAHFVSFGIGTLYWLMCALAFALMHNRVSVDYTERAERTIRVFFLLNLFVSTANLIYTMVISGSLNPYCSTDLRFGNSTGDFIRGIFMAPSYINMFVNAMFGIYFLYRGRYVYSFLAIAVACATSSNFANLVLLPLLVACLFILPHKKARVTIVLELLLYAAFYIFMSPGNFAYVRSSVAPKQMDSVEDRAFSKFYRGGGKLMHYCKVISVCETYEYLTSSKEHFILGAGMGNFSSQLAVRTSGLNAPSKSRLFQELPEYEAPAFKNNHYRIFDAVYSLPPEYHSIRHFPASFINQLLGEYGFTGLILFLFFYISFFLKRYRHLSYTIVMLVMVCGFLAFDYLFEYLSVMVFFELFYLIDLRTKPVVVL